MKLPIVFLSCVLFVVADHLPESEKRFLKHVHDSCQADPNTFCDENLLKKLVEYQEDPVVQIHMLCMAKKAGLITPYGELNVNTIREKVGTVLHDHNAVDRVVRKCAVEKRTVEQTGTQLWICFFQNNVPYYHKLL